MENTYRIFYFLAVIAALVSCAQISSPSGGAVDKEAPVVVSSYPENESVNFSGRIIEVEFDEYIQLNDIGSQLLISPPLEEKPEVTLKKKTVTLELKSTLAENTTYSINFGEGIKDYNAGNVLRNYTFAFSTGPELDSLSLTGSVTDAFSQEAVENVKVMLYEEDEDSLFLARKPVYFAQTDKEGNYTINYLPEGNYQIRALEEVNSNFLYDSPEERIAFLDSLISIKTDTLASPAINLKLFNEGLDKGYITSSKRMFDGVFRLGFNIPQEKVEILQVKEDSLVKLLNYYPRSLKDSLYFFTHDTTEVYVKRYGKSNDLTPPEIDTLMLSTFLGRDIENSSYPLFLKSSKRKLLPSESVFLESNLPINLIDTSKVQIMQDSVELSTVQLGISSDFKLNLGLDLEKSNPVKVTLYPGATLSNYGELKDTVNFVFSLQEKGELGELKFKFNEPQENRILVLENQKGEVIFKEKVLGVDTLITNLAPSKLTVYYFVDQDKSEDWTSGNYERKSPPEEIRRLQTKVEVRANWSLEFVWE